MQMCTSAAQDLNLQPENSFQVVLPLVPHHFTVTSVAAAIEEVGLWVVSVLGVAIKEAL